MKKNILLLIIISFMANFLLSGCSYPNATVSKSNFYFDTIVTITLYGTTNESYIDDCFSLAQKYENLLSATKSESEISQINKNAGSYVTVSDETLSLIQTGITYGELSNGLFDITIGKLSELWNISEISKNTDNFEKNIDESVLPSDLEIKNALSHVDYQKIQIDGNRVMLTDPESKLDLGGIAKGYIADRMKDFLIEQDITSAIINLGGNIQTIGAHLDDTPYTIGIQKPFDKTGTTIASLKIKDQSVVSSGIYERYYRIDDTIYHHILDTTTGYPYKNDLYEVTIICDNSVDGDALSTTCFALGLEKGMDLIESTENTEAVFITNDFAIHTTSGIGIDIPIEIYEIK